MRADRAIAEVARAHYGRLIAALARRCRDVAAAEDALSIALSEALDRWPAEGVPASPAAWLLTVARRKLIDGARHDAVLVRPDVEAALREQYERVQSEQPVPDDRLRLLFVCAHPAIDPEIRPALMLQVVLGLEAKEVATAFLVSPDAMAKRLVRAKAKIREAGVPFDEPAARDRPDRLGAVLEAIYAAYFLGREGTVSAGDGRDTLRAEAMALAEVVGELEPDDAETLGLRALLLLCEARRAASVAADGAFVPLLSQDTGRWDRERMRRGYALLAAAAARGAPGPFQLEAAIHGAHGQRAFTGQTPWPEIAELYRRLVDLAPTVGASVGLAVAEAHATGDPARGIAALDALPSGMVKGYPAYWAARAHLSAAAGDRATADACWSAAIGLTTHPRVSAWLRAQRAG